MAKEVHGRVLGSGKRIAIAVARWNSMVTERLLSGARVALRQHGVAEVAVHVAGCPGSVELPLLVQELARSGRYDAVIALGAIVRGETPHYEYIAAQAASGIAQAALQTGVPCIFGVLTAETLAQALERAGGKHGNKGEEAARSALEMADVLAQLRHQP
jgi:6,7-dimethyl-8-ribityllumazine synthase